MYSNLSGARYSTKNLYSFRLPCKICIYTSSLNARYSTNFFCSFRLPCQIYIDSSSLMVTGNFQKLLCESFDRRGKLSHQIVPSIYPSIWDLPHFIWNIDLPFLIRHLPGPDPITAFTRVVYPLFLIWKL